MTTLSKEDVVRMAEEAGCETVIWRAEPMLVYGDQMLGGFCDRFATLARADLVAENERLNKQYLAAVNGRREFRKHVVELRDQLTATRTALAAAELREIKLREFVKNSTEYRCGHPLYEHALAKPRDDSALREMIAGVYEECAKVCRKEAVVIVVDGPEERAYNNAISDCELAIRALAEKAKA